MTDLDLARIAAANDAWVQEPEGSTVVQTGEFRIVLLPEYFPDRLQVQWVRSTRPAAAVFDELVAEAARFGQDAAHVYLRFSAPESFDEELRARGASATATGDFLALPLPASISGPDSTGLDLRWRTTPDVGRDANTIGITVFGGNPAPDEVIAKAAAEGKRTYEDGTGGALVAYLDGVPVAVSGVQIVDGVARLTGGAVLEGHRGRGVYRALVAERLKYAEANGATLALSQADVTTSSPILRRLGFVSCGRERGYRLPMAG